MRFRRRKLKKKVAAFAEIPNHENVKVQYDHDNDEGEWVYQVFEVIIDHSETNEGHTATWGWYAINPENGQITDLLQ